MTTCIIIEDQPPAQRILKKYIGDIGSLELKATFSDALQALEYLQAEPIDLLFLDIHLPKISGIDFLKTLTNPPKVILTTAFPNYALESYELDVVDYLLKPFSFQRFVKAVAKVTARNLPLAPPDSLEEQPGARQEVFIKSGYEFVKVKIAQIVYIKSDADYTEIHTEGKKILSPEPLRYWLKTLSPDQFTQIHRSYIINTGHIEKIAGPQVHLINEMVIPIGRAYKEEFIRRFVK